MEPAAGREAPPLNRQAIALLALGGFFVALYLLLHKLGVVGSLLCGVGDCSAVQLSPYAVFLGVPVPVLGVVGYALLCALALVGSQPARVTSRLVAALLLGFGTVAFGFSVYFTYLEAFVIHAWCQWCVASAVVATLIFAFSLSEIPRLRGRSR